MQISVKHGFAFLCMPKCVSTSIEVVIRQYCNTNLSATPAPKHIDAQGFAESILSTHQKLYPSSHIESFCLIREPLERMESWYRYRSRNELKNPRHPNHKRYTGNISYNDFIQQYISKDKKKSFTKLKTQYRFLILHNGQIGIDHILPMDRMDLVNDFLSKKIGKKIKIPFKNVSPKMPLSLDRKLEEKLREYLTKDQIIYDFVKNNGKYNKALHSENLSALLQDCR